MRPRRLFGILGFGIPVLALFAAGTGSYALSPSEILNLCYESLIGNEISNPRAHYVLFQLRIPRILMSIITGASLGLAGAAMQGLFRNPLVSPGLAGVSAGAAMFTALAFVFGGAMVQKLTSVAGEMGVSLIGFTGAMLAMSIAWNVARRGKSNPTLNLILTGIAITALSESVIGLSQFVATDQQLRSIIHWQLGSFSGASYTKVLALMTLFIPATLILWKQIRGLNALALGEENAGSLGIRLPQLRLWVLISSSALVGAAVALTGMIAFVGLVTPHLIRLVTGPNHRYVMPGAAMAGALLLLAADTVSRNLNPTQEVPLSILTSVIGAPFLIYLIIRENSGHDSR